MHRTQRVGYPAQWHTSTAGTDLLLFCWLISAFAKLLLSPVAAGCWLVDVAVKIDEQLRLLTNRSAKGCWLPRGRAQRFAASPTDPITHIRVHMGCTLYTESKVIFKLRMVRSWSEYIEHDLILGLGFEIETLKLKSLRMVFLGV